VLCVVLCCSLGVDNGGVPVVMRDTSSSQEIPHSTFKVPVRGGALEVVVDNKGAGESENPFSNIMNLSNFAEFCVLKLLISM
jgi:hypothetical protein